MKKVRTDHNLNLGSATNDSIIVFIKISLYIRLAHLRSKTVINWVKTFSANILVETDFMDYMSLLSTIQKTFQVTEFQTDCYPFELRVEQIYLSRRSIKVQLQTVLNILHTR